MQQKEEKLFSFFELWPGWLFNMPLVVWWALLSARYLSITLPVLSNPKLPLGGLCGESKEELFSFLGPLGMRMMAPYVVFKTTGNSGDDLKTALTKLKGVSLSFPLIAKPDLGMNGTGVQRVRTEVELQTYLEEFPTGAKLILQRLIDEPGEAGIFYVRLPSESVGRITSVTLKHFPSVVGDGKSNVRELIQKDKRASHIALLYFKRHKEQLGAVLKEGEELRLVTVGNHVKGARFTNGASSITPQMVEVFDRIAKEIPEFRYGRFDVRFPTLEHLQKGEFTILEYNGASSEPTHIWDKDEKILDAYKAYLSSIHSLFVIGDYYRKIGYKPAGVLEVWRAFRHESEVLRTYPQGREV